MRKRSAFLSASLSALAALAVSVSPARGADSRGDSAQVERNLAAYIKTVDSLQAVLDQWPKDSIISGEQCVTTATRFCLGDDTNFVAYLKMKKAFAVGIQERLNGGVLRYADYIDSVKPRLDGFLAKEGEFSGKLGQHAVSRREYQAYNAYLQPLLSKSFLSYAKASSTLMSAKYFTEGNEGNFLEGFFNGACGFTRTEPDPAKAGKDFGVSPFEILMRVEPLYVLGDNDVQNFGGLFSAGLLFHFLPAVTVLDDFNGTVAVKQSFASSVLKDIGIKGGFGATSDKINPTAGWALQAGPFSVWYVYTWNKDRWDFALSLSDLGVVKTLLPIFK